MTRGKRFFLYCQHLAGTGHFVRTYEIASALAERHDVYLVDGGRTIPRPAFVDGLQLVELPRIYRVGQDVVPLESACPLDEVMRRRLQVLLPAIEKIRPDVLMVEHFPFSKWELYDEIQGIVRHAQIVNKDVRVVCSLRDIVPATRYEVSEAELHRAVLETLHAHFDLVLIHADPRLVRLETHIPWADEINVPIEYTGYVSQKPNGLSPGRSEIDCRCAGPRKTTIVSAGGDCRTGLTMTALAAWERLLAQGAVGDRTLTMFLPLFPRPEELALLERQAGHPSVRLLPFATSFLDWMHTAELSISQAGYNTCTNILQTRTRSILVPNAHMPDQLQRARLFAKHGLAAAIDSADLTPERLADAMLERFQSPPPEHDIDLQGARTTRQILERLLTRECAAVAGAAEIADN